MADLAPLIILGCFRSGTTAFYNTLLSAVRNGIALDPDDFEMRSFWQRCGLTLGTPKSGSYCRAAGEDDVTDDIRGMVQQALRQRTEGGRIAIGKSPHLANKIGYVHGSLPAARFIHLVRECYATTASQKLGMELIFGGQNAQEQPFVFYWPDELMPCWCTVPVAGTRPRRLKQLRQWLGVDGQMPYAIPHVDGLAFREQHPDPDRYYPGAGFPRIAESWVRINRYIRYQLSHLPQALWMTVSYEQLCADTVGEVQRVSDYFGLSVDPKLVTPMRTNSLQKWRRHLSVEDQQMVASVLAALSQDVTELSQIFPNCVACTSDRNQ